MNRNPKGTSTALSLYQPRNDASSYDDTRIGRSIFIASNVHVRFVFFCPRLSHPHQVGHIRKQDPSCVCPWVVSSILVQMSVPPNHLLPQWKSTFGTRIISDLRCATRTIIPRVSLANTFFLLRWWLDRLTFRKNLWHGCGRKGMPCLMQIFIRNLQLPFNWWVTSTYQILRLIDFSDINPLRMLAETSWHTSGITISSATFLSFSVIASGSWNPGTC